MMENKKPLMRSLSNQNKMEILPILPINLKFNDEKEKRSND